MKLMHAPTDAEYTELAYPDGDEEAVEPEPAEDEGLDAPKPKPKSKNKPKSKPKSKPKKKANKSSAEDEPTSASEAETSSSDDNPYGEDDENGADDNDPDEEVEVTDGTFLVKAIHGHRLLSTGKHSYDVEWVGYKNRTWEKEHHLHEKFRSQYHSELAKTTALDAAKEATSAAARRGGRARRGPGAQDVQTLPLSKRLEMRAHSLAGEGMPYYPAYEQAQRELGYA
jgi:hypothetical protein